MRDPSACRTSVLTRSFFGASTRAVTSALVAIGRRWKLSWTHAARSAFSRILRWSTSLLASACCNTVTGKAFRLSREGTAEGLADVLNAIPAHSKISGQKRKALHCKCEPLLSAMA